MATILHLSDLHFGEVIDLPTRDAGLLNYDKGAKHLAQTIYKHIVSGDNEGFSNPDCVLITGDITNRALAHEFELAEVFLKELTDLLSIDKNRFLILPGNHDISWDAEKSDHHKKYTAFKMFYERFFKTEWSFKKTTKMIVDIPGIDEKILIIGFNSCSVENSSWRGMGYISEHQFNEVENWLSKNDGDKFRIRLAALHHHVLPVHNYHPSFVDFNPDQNSLEAENPPPVSSMLNASQLLKKCRKLKVSAILHGHAHTQYSVRQTNFLEIDAKDSDHISRSIAVIGTGTPSSERLDNYHNKCFQIIQFHHQTRPTFFHLRCFNTLIEQRTITETKQSNIILPGGHEVFEVPTESVGQLRTTLNNIILKEQELPTDIIDGEDLDGSFDSLSLYDSLLESVVNWLDAHRGRSFGHAIISRYMKDLKVYKTLAIYRYDEEVRHIVYDLEEKSITVECANTNRVQNIASRKNCEFASSKRNQIYQRTLGGEDQICLAIPLNSMNKTYPYAILGFARAKINKSSLYDEYDTALVDSIKDMVEDGIRQTEMADVAEKRRRILHLSNWLRNYFEKTHETDVLDDLEIIADRIYSHLGLSKENKDALAISLPKPPYYEHAYCVVERGFGRVKADRMTYQLGKEEGLTGRILDTREYDYCMDHLNTKKVRKSIRGQKSSGKCEKAPISLADLRLSFVGVPLGAANREYNRGALVLNITTPLGQGGSNYMKSNYVEPLQIISQFLNPLIEGPWKKYCKREERKHKQNRPKRMKKKE
jgi:3',5'-cyclic AMP phosphodiesterase CpdA